MYTLVFFVPTKYKEKVKEACFLAGAGVYDGYDQCCFELNGTGQFRPLAGSNPHIGKHNQIEKVTETRVEMVINPDLVAKVIEALKKSHPYEVPAYYLYQQVSLS